MPGHARDRLVERRARGVMIAAAQMARANRVPGVGLGLARVDVVAARRQLALEPGEGLGHVAPSEAQQPLEPVERDRRCQ